MYRAARPPVAVMGVSYNSLPDPSAPFRAAHGGWAHTPQSGLSVLHALQGPRPSCLHPLLPTALLLAQLPCLLSAMLPNWSIHCCSPRALYLLTCSVWPPLFILCLASGAFSCKGCTAVRSSAHAWNPSAWKTDNREVTSMRLAWATR